MSRSQILTSSECLQSDVPVDQSTLRTHEQIGTPWDVHGSVSSDGKQQAIDYDKLVDQFGTRRIDSQLLVQFETLTGHRPHVFLRGAVIFSPTPVYRRCSPLYAPRSHRWWGL